MRRKKHLSAGLALVGAIALAATAVTPAHADIPKAGTVFQVQTTFEGAAVCASVGKTEYRDPFFPLSPCDKANKGQQWRVTDKGYIENVASGRCISDMGFLVVYCQRARRGQALRQDSQNHVFVPGKDALSKTYWGAQRLPIGGLQVTFPGTVDGTVPRPAASFAFPAA
jgi:hypothetical protein